VRVNKAYPPALLDVLDSHIFHHHCFSHPSFPDKINMPTPIVSFNPELSSLVSESGLAKKINLVIHNYSEGTSGGASPLLASTRRTPGAGATLLEGKWKREASSSVFKIKVPVL
jgi:hypothetical protein